MRALLVGDSHMQALGPRLSELMESYGVEVVGSLANAGKSTAWYAEQQLVERAVLTNNPDVVVFALGGNDQCWGEAEQERAMRALVAQAGAAHVVWVGPLSAAVADVDRRHACSTSYSRAIARKLRIPFLDLRRYTPHDMYRDGVHLTAAGYDQLSLDIAEPLSDLIRGRRTGYGFALGAASLVAVMGIFYAVVR